MSFKTLSPAAVTTPESALALYDLATTCGAAAAYEAAAHALARALRRQVALAAALPRAQAAAPVAVVQSGPMGAPCEPVKAPPVKRRAKAADKPEPDALAEPFTTPKKTAAVGSFWVVWADGAATHVSGVVYNSAKPATRWAAALRAADNLRRLRNRRALRDELTSMAHGAPVAAETVGAAYIRQESAAFLALVQSCPLAPLLAIYDETSAEMFEPPHGRPYGAGDSAKAWEAAARMVPPRACWIDEARGADFLARRRRDAAEAFAVARIAETATPGPQVASARELDGQTVAIDGERLPLYFEALKAALSDATKESSAAYALTRETLAAAQDRTATPADVAAYSEASRRLAEASGRKNDLQRAVDSVRILLSRAAAFVGADGAPLAWKARVRPRAAEIELTATDGRYVALDAGAFSAVRLAA